MVRNLAAVVLGSVLLCAGLGPQASAAKKLFKYDQFPESIDSAADALGNGLTSAQAGYAKGEAFGVIFTPAPGDYPLTITTLDLVVPGVCQKSENNQFRTPATIEMWFGEGAGPAPPSATPTWTVDTTDLLLDAGAGATAGIYLSPNVALHITFDPDDPDGHPPQVFSGKIWVAVRFPFDPKDLAAEWGTCATEGSTAASGCAKTASQCGCQPVGTLHDGLITPGVNIINHTAGGCDGGGVMWSFMENLGISGDVVMRLGVETPDSGCTPSCGSKVCGSDGCGGACGVCGSGTVCSLGMCIEGGGCTPSCGGAVCGSDGCGGVCGVCGAGQSCVAGTCQTTGAQCVPSCAGKVCGDDGCGGPCGVPCGSGLTCTAGACVEAPVPQGDAPTVDSVSPNFGVTSRSTEISIIGTGFREGVEARLGAKRLGVIELVGTTLISAVVPEGMDPGTYDLTVINSDDTTTTLKEAFVVGAEASSGCAGAGGGAPTGGLGGALALSLALLAWGAGRRRAARARG
jgi:hypothetical protein